MKSFKFKWNNVLAYLLSAFFLVGSITNIVNPDSIAADYARWGYPSWFHFVTGSLELATAALLLNSRFRFRGAMLGGAVMMAAVATVVLHGEHAHAIAPLMVLLLVTIVGWRSKPSRFA